jgi:hypothetical protein
MEEGGTAVAACYHAPPRRVEALDEGEVEAPLAGSCTPPLPALPPRVNDDVDTDRPLVAYGRSTEAAALAVLIVA